MVMRTLTDCRLQDLVKLFEMVDEENARQIRKWGIQIRTPFEWMTYLTEEVGEISKAISEAEYRGAPLDDVVTEAIQAATLALKIAEMYSKEDTRERD